MDKKEIFKRRREELCNEMKRRGVGVFVGAANRVDNIYPLNQDSVFRYYFGVHRENLIGIIDFKRGTTYISGDDFTLEDIIWLGETKTILEESQEYGIENFVKRGEVKELIKMLEYNEEWNLFPSDIMYKETNKERYEKIVSSFRAKPVEKIHYINPYNEEMRQNTLSLVHGEYSRELHLAIINQRNIKTDLEIESINKAVNVTRKMHLKAMETIKPGMYEYEVRSEVEKVAIELGCEISFQTIATVRGEILHNRGYNNILKEGDLLVLDCGARTNDGYCGDMTTTIPVSGKFTLEQKQIYEILIKMYDAAEKELLVDKFYKDAYVAASKELIEGMKELGIFKGESKEILESGAHSIIFPHGLGHMVGLDVHDCENLDENLVGYDDEIKRDLRPGYNRLRLARRLKNGFVFSVEPGIYFIPGLIDSWKEKGNFKEYIDYEKLDEYRNFGGMRYEGDYAMINGKGVRLGGKMPKSSQEIEEIMKK